jgi:uncharacterized protein (DUF4415 family)
VKTVLKNAGDGDLVDDVSQLDGWKRARRRVDPLAAKVPSRRITINIDEDIIAILKAEAFLGGPPYQVAINQALRQYLRSREQSERASAAETVLLALEEPEVRRRLRALR